MIKVACNQPAGKKIPAQYWSSVVKSAVRVLKLKPNGEISLGLVNNQTIKKLNWLYRRQNIVTDVLSFAEADGKNWQPNKGLGQYLGEIIICYPQAVKQAKQNGNRLKQELQLLFTHGFLHLLGYDHQNAKNLAKMKQVENQILAKIKLTRSVVKLTNLC